MDTVNQLLFGGNANSAEHGSRHLAEHGFDDVEPGAVFRREDELEALLMKSEIGFRLLGDVRGMIVEKRRMRAWGGYSASILLSKALKSTLACCRCLDRQHAPKVTILEATDSAREPTK